MTKYRIRTNGSIFYLERKCSWFIFSRWCNTFDAGDMWTGSRVVEFSSEDSAEEYAKIHYGICRKRIRKLRVQ